MTALGQSEFFEFLHHVVGWTVRIEHRGDDRVNVVTEIGEQDVEVAVHLTQMALEESTQVLRRAAGPVGSFDLDDASLTFWLLGDEQQDVGALPGAVRSYDGALGRADTRDTEQPGHVRRMDLVVEPFPAGQHGRLPTAAGRSTGCHATKVPSRVHVRHQGRHRLYDPSRSTSPTSGRSPAALSARARIELSGEAE